MDGIVRKFDGSVSFGGDPASDGVGDRQRDSLFLIASLVLPDEAGARDVRIRNLSERGVMVEVGRDVAIDTTTRLTLRSIGEVTGKVVWNVDDRIGIALDRAIDPKRARKSVGAAPGKAPPAR